MRQPANRLPILFIDQKRASLCFALFLLLLIYTPPLYSFSRLGLWVVRDDITSKEKIDQLFDFAEKNHVSDLFIQVRGRGDAYYESRFISKSEHIKDRDFDPLLYACSKAFASPIKIHAWFNTYLLYSNHFSLPPDEHIFNLFPEWLEMSSDGVWDNVRLYQTPQPRWHEGAFLSPIHPRVNDYLLILVKEIMTKYLVDGIHFDYLRYQNRQFGYNPSGRERFREETGIDPARYMSGGSAPDRKTFLLLYDQYRMNSITDFLSKVQAANQELIFPLEISAAVKSDPLKAKREFFQDWGSWLLSNKVDFIIPMMYDTDLKRFDQILKNIDSVVPPAYREKIWGGIGVWNQPWHDTAQKINRIKAHKYDKIAFFSWKVLRENPAYFQSLQKFLNLDKE